MLTRKLKTAPTVEPLSTSEIKDRLRIDATADDALVDALVAAARTHVENYLERALLTQTWQVWLDAFPSGDIILPRPPLQSVTSVKYYDTDGTLQTLSSAVYTVDANSTPGRIYLAWGQTWPSTRDIQQAVVIEYVAGYGTSSTSVPANIVTAVALLTGHWYENREAVVIGAGATELPLAVKALLAGARVPEGE